MQKVFEEEEEEVNLKLNDRVRVYGHSQVQKGSVVLILKDGIISVADETDGADYVVHSKQCRKLVKRLRREWWIRVCMNDDEHEIITPVEPESACTHCEVIRVLEVKEKK